MSWHAQIGDGQYLDGWQIVYVLNLLDSRIERLKKGTKSLKDDNEITYANDIRNKLQMATLGETPPMKLEIKT